MDAVSRKVIHRLVDGKWQIQQDDIANESILNIDIEKDKICERWLSILRTPGDDYELICGLLHNERVLRDCSIKDVELRVEDDSVTVIIPTQGSYDITPRGRIDNGTACGICGRKDLSDLLDLAHNCEISGIDIDPEILLSMPSKMLQTQTGFTSTGGIHAAALFTAEGEIILVKEDIGRHNAFDKAIGASLRTEIIPKIIGLSGRIGWELVAKAIRSNVEIIIAVGAISSAAETLSRNSGITLVGFASREKPVVIGPLNRIIDKP